MHFNARSLSKNLSVVTDILHSLDTSLDIIGISESKLKEGVDLSTVHIQGYGLLQHIQKWPSEVLGYILSMDLTALGKKIWIFKLMVVNNIYRVTNSR